MVMKIQKRIRELDIIFEELDFHLNYVPTSRSVVPRVIQYQLDMNWIAEKFIVYLLNVSSPIFKKGYSNSNKRQPKTATWAQQFMPFEFLTTEKYQISELSLTSALLRSLIVECYSFLNRNIREELNETDVSPEKVIEYSDIINLSSG